MLLFMTTFATRKSSRGRRLRRAHLCREKGGQSHDVAAGDQHASCGKNDGREYSGRLKGGDPLLFGRGGEEAEALAAEGLGFEIIPGVSSALAAPAYAGIPITHRGHASQVTIFTGHEDPVKSEGAINYESLAKSPGAKVMLMGTERIEQIAAKSDGTWRRPETCRSPWSLGDAGTAKDHPGTAKGDRKHRGKRAVCALRPWLMFGDVVTLRDKLNWFETRPLFGRRIW